MPHPILSLIKETLAVLKLQVHVDTSTPKPITFSLVSFPSWRNSEEKSFHSFVWLRFSVLIVSRTTSLQGNLHKMIYSLWTEKCSHWKMQDSNWKQKQSPNPTKGGAISRLRSHSKSLSINGRQVKMHCQSAQTSHTECIAKKYSHRLLPMCLSDFASLATPL